MNNDANTTKPVNHFTFYAAISIIGDPSHTLPDPMLQSSQIELWHNLNFNSI